MTATQLAPVIRRAGEGDKRWFFGGGVWTWKVSGEQSGGTLSVVEVEMEGGKQTPVHTHPIPESMWVLEGQIKYRIVDEDVVINAGDYVMMPAEIPHAFTVVSDMARILAIQPSDVCEAFYLGASEPLEGSARVTDFGRIAQSGQQNGGFTMVAPPPF